MSSKFVSDFSEDHFTNVNVSQTSEDLFEESPEIANNSFKSRVKRIISPQENSSETSEELRFIHRRKPRKYLNFSNDSSTYYSKKNSSSFSSLNASSSKVFRPISPECEVDAPYSSSFLEVKQSGFVKAFKSNDFSNLSKENVEVISCIPESDHSDSSSILDDSSNSERKNKSSKKSFKTPVFNSVKKRTICQWLSNISLNCSVEPSWKGINCKQAFISPESPITENQSPEPHNSVEQNVSQIINSTAHIPSSIFIEDGSDITFNTRELEAINGAKTKSLCHSFEFSKNNSTVNYCPWLFEEDEKSSNGNLANKNEMCNNSSILHNNCDEIKDCNLSDTCNKSFTKFIDLNPRGVLGEQQENSNEELLVHSVRNISKRDKYLAKINNSSISNKSDDGNDTSANESGFTYYQTDLKKEIKAVDSDDSFIHARSSKKKKNCLNVSSDDSEAKDTANDSEDIPNHCVDPYTPKRRLYFRNPLNNSLDDDAEPVAYGSAKKLNANAGINSTGNCLVKSKGLLDEICLEVFSVSKTNKKKLSVENQDVPSDPIGSNFIKGAVDSIPSVQNNSCFSDAHLSSLKDHTNPNEFSDSVIGIISKTNDNLNQLNFSADEPVRNSSTVDISGNDRHNVTKNYFETISPSKEARERFSLSKSCSNVDNHESSPVLIAGLDESWDSMVHIKRKSKRNVLNDSIDDSFKPNKAKSNIIDVGEICDDDLTPKNEVNDSPVAIISPKIKAFVNLVNSDDEFDKYIYRTRSDSCSSLSQDSSVLHKDSLEDVISIHTTTEDEGQNEDNNAPWFDLEMYLKKHVPASSKSLNSSFFENLSKREAQLAKIVLPSYSDCPEHTSFLLSLTSEVPDEMCHPEAVKYRDSFSKHKNELVNLLFKLYNKKIFDNKLPPLEIKWSGHLTTTSGITKSSSKITKSGKLRISSIKLSKTVVDNASKLRDVLLHELCHAANWLIDEQAGGHGPLFKKWVNKIWMKFPEIPKVKTTHHYELKWKYLYKCTFCGYELGKMKLSLNENSCRLCGGLVTVNA